MHSTRVDVLRRTHRNCISEIDITWKYNTRTTIFRHTVFRWDTTYTLQCTSVVSVAIMLRADLELCQLLWPQAMSRWSKMHDCTREIKSFKVQADYYCIVRERSRFIKIYYIIDRMWRDASIVLNLITIKIRKRKLN